MPTLNETHDAALVSWVESANAGDGDFPIQNLPYAVLRRAGSDEPFRGGVAIGDAVLDLAAAAAKAPFDAAANELLALAAGPELNAFMARGADDWSTLRLALSRGLRAGSPRRAALEGCLLPRDAVEYGLPCRIGDYTDFYTSIHHASNVGKLFRPDDPLPSNYRWLPLGYHGRASSIRVSGHAFHRPRGQTRAPGADTPGFGPCRRLDYEAEVGIYIGTGNAPGTRIALDDADRHVFGFCLFNDWSARDIQAWEYQPLGPFLAKSFASTVSPWVVTNEALLPYRVQWTRAGGEPRPLDYLDSAANRESGALDLRLQTRLETAAMRADGAAPQLLGETSFAGAYWTVAQLVAHHTVGGCNLRPGDLFGSGTQSGAGATELGSLLEITAGGAHELALPNGETRRFLEDGDRIVMTGHCAAPGYARIGFGNASATVLAAV